MGLFGIGGKEIASLPVPGEGRVELPAGRIKVRYAEDRDGRSTDGSNRWHGPDESLEVRISPGGVDVPIKKPRMISEGAGRGVIHKDLGSIELDAGSACDVSATMSLEQGEHPNPRVIFRA